MELKFGAVVELDSMPCPLAMELYRHMGHQNAPQMFLLCYQRHASVLRLTT